MADEEDIDSQIKQFPSSFDLDTQHINNRRTKDIIERLLKDIECSYDSDEEICRAWNLLSYLYWLLGDNAEATHFNNYVIKWPTAENIISLSNKTYFCLKQPDYFQARHYLAKLKELQGTRDYKYLFDTAKSELAFSYSCFGPKYYDKSIERFEEVVKRNPEMYLWKFGLGLAYRRIMHLSTGSYAETEVDIQQVFNCFDDVARNVGKGRQLKGRGWLELGELIYSKNHNEKLRAIRLSGCISDDKFYFKKALKFGENDPFILERCGKYFRYYGDFSQSKEFLETSIKLKPTSFNHHHIALTIQRIEWNKLADNFEDGFTKPGRRRRGLNKSFSTGQLSLADSGIGSMSTNFASMNLHTRGDYHRSISEPQRMPSHDTYNRISQTPVNQQAKEVAENRRLLKSPLKVPKSPGNAQFLLAVFHLKKSIELSDNNNSARLDLGLLYINLEEYDNALIMFKEVLDKRFTSCSAIEAARSYEQQGLCMREMSDHPKYKGEKESLLHNANVCFNRAVESIAVLMAKHPNLGSCLNSFPTLKNMLITSKKPEIANVKTMAKLCELLHKYGEAVDFYTEILNLTDEEDHNPEIYRKLAQNYLKIKDFDNALFLLTRWCCTEHGNSSQIFSQLKIQSHLEGAMHKLRSGDEVSASEWYHRAFLFAHDKNIGGDDDGCHVAIFCELRQENGAPIDIVECLESFNLKVTINSESILATQTIEQGNINILKESGHIVLVLQGTEISNEFQFIVRHAMRLHSESQHKHPVLVITVGLCIIPEILACVPHLQFISKREESAIVDSHSMRRVSLDPSGTQRDIPAGTHEAAAAKYSIDFDCLTDLLTKLVIHDI